MNLLDREIQRTARTAVNRAGRKVLDRAIRWSSGPLKSNELARRDHPYAKRHGPEGLPSLMPRGNPAIINVQTGAFRAAWSKTQPESSRDGASLQVRNDDRKADILGSEHGTEHMIPRPIKAELEAGAVGQLDNELRKAVQRLELKYG
jgi:hypothetical protein